MLLHVFVSPVCAGPIHVTAQRTNSLLKQSLTLRKAAAMTTVAAGLPGVFSFLCRQVCSHQWRRPPEWSVHCKPQGQGGVMICRPIKVCTAAIFCLFYLLLPVLHLSPELRSTADQVFGSWKSTWGTWSRCLCLLQSFASELCEPLRVCLHQVK